jgi:type 1 fimbria pilin
LKNLGFTFLYNRVPNQIILDITSDTGTVKTTTIDLIGKANRPAINIQRSSANGLSSHIAKIKVTLVGQQDTDVRLARMYANSFFTGGVKYLSNGGGVMAGDIDFNKFKAIRKVWDSGTTANRPINPAQYQEFFDTSIGKPIWYVGAVWKDAAGTTV